VVWSHNRYIVGLLLLVILGHWTLILQGMTTVNCKTGEAKSPRKVSGCELNGLRDPAASLQKLITPSWLQSSFTPCASIFWWSSWTCTNCSALALGLHVYLAQIVLGSWSSLTVLFISWLRAYFLCSLAWYFFKKHRHSFAANLSATVFLLLKLNPILGVMFNIPAAVFSTVRCFFDQKYVVNYWYRS